MFSQFPFSNVDLHTSVIGTKICIRLHADPNPDPGADPDPGSKKRPNKKCFYTKMTGKMLDFLFVFIDFSQ